MNGHRDDKEEGKGKQPEEIAMMPKPGWGNGGHPDDEDPEGSCGLASCRPGFLKSLTSMWTFAVMFGLSLLMSDSAKNYLTSQLMFFERQFELSPQTTGFLVSCSDIGYLVGVLFTSYFARRWSIPRVLAICTAVFGVGSLICVLPHAVVKNDLRPPPVVHPNDTLTMEALLLKSPSCMIGNLPPEALGAVMMEMAKGMGGPGMGGSSGPVMAPPQPPPKTNPDQNPAYYEVKKTTPTPKPKAAGAADPDPGMAVESETDDSEDVVVPPVDQAPPDQIQPQKTTTTRDPAPPQPVVPPQVPAVNPNEAPLMMPNFTKLATHKDYEKFAMMAQQMFQIDLKAVAAMPLRQQVEYVNNLPPNVKVMLPNLKLLLGPDADSYFMPQPKFNDNRRRKRAARPRVNPAADMMHNGYLAKQIREGKMMMMSSESMNALFDKLCPFSVGPFHNESSSATTTIGLVAFGMLLQGIARAPRMAFATVFVDDNVDEFKTAFYLGIIFCMSALSVPVSVGIGGWSVMSYVTLEDVGGMSYFNPKWLSAWWLGYLFYGVVMIILAVPILLFPRNMPGKPRSYILNERPKPLGFAKSLFRVVTNPVFLLISLASGAVLLAHSGTFAHIHKYMETQFSLKPFEESLYLTMVCGLVGAIGAIIGGVVACRFKLTPLNCLKVVVVLLCAVTVVQACTLGFGCDQPHLNKGDKVLERNEDNTTKLVCKDTCVCMDEMYSPVCGSDGVSYFSPCHAGCGEAYDGKYHDCKCLGDTEQTAEPHLCKQPCSMLYPYSVFMALATFLLGGALVPGILAAMRSVEARDIPLAIGSYGFITTLIASGIVPARYIFGSIVEGVCAMTRPACGPSGSCAFYDIVQFRLEYNGLATGIFALATLLSAAALVLGLRPTSVYQNKIHEKERRM